MTRKRALHWTLRIVGLAIVAFAVRAAATFPWREVGEALRAASPALIVLALVVNLVSLGARGWSWHLLLRPAAPNRFTIAQEATVVGAAVGSVSVSVAGEGTRARFISRRDGVPLSLALAAIVWSRVVESLGLVLVLVAVPFFLHPSAQIRWLQLGAGLVGLGWLLFLILRRRHGISGNLPGVLRAPLETMGRIPARGGRLLAPTLLALVNWFAQWATYHLAFEASGIPISISASFAAVVIANLAWVFRFTPGNVGVMQGSIALALLPFGVEPGRAVLGGLVLQAIQTIPILALAAALTGVRGLRALMRAERDEQVERETPARRGNPQ